MIAPQAFKLKCSKCGYTKIFKPKSDVLDILDIDTYCPKCNIKMNKVPLNIFDKVLYYKNIVF